jgi:hypothetical protein
VALKAPRPQHSLNQSVIHHHLMLQLLLLGILLRLLLLAAELVQPVQHQRRRRRRRLLLGSVRPWRPCRRSGRRPGGSRRWLAARGAHDLHAARAAQQRRCLCCR